MIEHQDPAPHRFGSVHVDVRWASILSGTSVGHLRRLCRAGRIEGAHRRHGTGNWRIPIASLDRDLSSAMKWYLDHTLAGPTAFA